jgi:hypothetical protein
VIANCDIVKPSDDGGNGTGLSAFGGTLSNLTVLNTSSFGFGTAFSSGTYGGSSGHNATDGASAPGSNNQTSATYADQFQAITDATMDFRAK